MLICPYCSSENPDSHKFCQACGHLLTEQPCPGCGSLVAVQLEQCPVCQTFTGTTWYAICAGEAFAEINTAAIAAGKGDAYLDKQQRYRILECLSAAESPASELTLRVLDSNPLQPSPLHLLQQPSTNPQVQAYLKLQTDYHSLALPDIQDAWEVEDGSVILLGDRSDLPLLSEVWSAEAVLPLQILHWLHEISTLWLLLEPHRACRSLLELTNLYVDEDHLLCLQRLYFDSPGQTTEIKQLADLWQQLFQESQLTYQAELALLHNELVLGKITSAEALRARIEAIAILLQTHDDLASLDQTEPLDPSLYPPEFADAAGEKTTSPDAAAQAEGNTIPFNLSGSNMAAGASSSEAGVNTAWLEAVDLSEEGWSDGEELPTIVLPMRLVSLEDAGRTDVGRQRDHNEDCFNIQTEFRKIETPQGRSLEAKGLYILCDGMGGHAGGEVASALAVETLSQYFAAQWDDKLPSEVCIREGILQANQAIYALNQEDARSGSGRMGTTLVLVLIQNTEAAIAHVGDSRLYRLSRSRGLEQLTVDHEVGQREIQRGVEPAIAYARPDSYQLTQALGPRDGNFINPDVKFFELNEDLLLLLCSDGLSDNNLLERHWQNCLEPMLRTQLPLEQGVNQLIDLANEQNGHDNVTALVIRAKVRPNVELIGQKLEKMQK